jgi:probable rRNA maturation factor
MSPAEIDLAVEDPRWQAALGDPDAFVTHILAAVFTAEAATGAVSVALTDDATVQDLNARFRGKDSPTNVLSFPPPDAFPGFLGDIVLAFDTVAREADEQGKALTDHARHLLAHGLFHLLGYDHETEADAAVMEGKERALLMALGGPDPYPDHA